jgi:hypothetical protein
LNHRGHKDRDKLREKLNAEARRSRDAEGKEGKSLSRRRGGAETQREKEGKSKMIEPQRTQRTQRHKDRDKLREKLNAEAQRCRDAEGKEGKSLSRRRGGAGEKGREKQND